MLKRCSKCGIEKEWTTQFYRVAKREPNGLSYQCKECDRAYRTANKEKIKIICKKWNEENKSKVAEIHKKYYNENKSELLNKMKKYYLENSVVIKNRVNNYRKNNLEVIKTKKKQYAIKYHDVILSRAREKYSNNRDRYIAYTLKWVQSHRDYKNVISRRYKARKKLLDATLSPLQWEEIKLYFNNSCAYCGKEKPLHQEHFVAASKGGEYTHNNIIPSCKSCNNSKFSKSFFEWYPKFKYYSKKRERAILLFLHYKDGVQQLGLF